MKNIKQLSEKEQQNINGGAGQSTSAGTSTGVGADSLLTITLEAQNGDQSRKTTISVGNDIDANVNAVFGNTKA